MFGASSRHDKVFYEGFTKQAERVAAAAQLLQTSLSSKTPDGAARTAARELRQSADQIGRNLICELRKTWITPFDPQDIRYLITELDGVSEAVHGALERLTLFDPVEGDGERGEAQRLAALLVRSTEAIAQALARLGKKREEPEVLRLCGELRRMEGESGEIYREALARLYRAGRDQEHGPGEAAVIEVLKWHDLFEQLEDVAARCRRVSDEIETIVEGHA
jgi:uncharacterized protein Yka (UPF0111/DUF47 family)